MLKSLTLSALLAAAPSLHADAATDAIGDRSSGMQRPPAVAIAPEAAPAFDAAGGEWSAKAAFAVYTEGLRAIGEVVEREPDAGAEGGPGLALLAAKVLTCELEGPGFVNRGVVLIEDGRIVAVGRRDEVEIPDDYEVVDVGANWLMPGMVDLHAHVVDETPFPAVNDAVLLTNPGLRVSSTIIPGNTRMRQALAAGVTTLLFIPGSGSTIGGQGSLVKTAPGTLEERTVADPAALKIAQYGNPERWGGRVGKSYLFANLRADLDAGRAYAERWRAFEAGEGERPAIDPDLEVYHGLFDGTVPVAVHTQVVQVVAATIDILRVQYGLNVFVDHGTFDSWRVASYCFEQGVAAILGPRNVSMPDRGMIDWTGDNPERVQGVAAGWWDEGHRMIGFNTDSPNVPQHELALQAAIAVRHGFPDDRLQTVRGLTIVPALTIGMGHRLGSLEAGKDADVVVLSGHPADPRTKVREVFVEGVKAYDEEAERAKEREPDTGRRP